MTTIHMSDEELLKKLSIHPHVRKQIESLLLAVEDEAGELKEADAAEMRVIEDIRRLGQEALQAWATNQVEKTSKAVRQIGGTWSEGKKNCAGTPHSETSP
jgi:hypothetical protein